MRFSFRALLVIVAICVFVAWAAPVERDTHIWIDPRTFRAYKSVEVKRLLASKKSSIEITSRFLAYLRVHAIASETIVNPRTSISVAFYRENYTRTSSRQVRIPIFKYLLDNDIAWSHWCQSHPEAARNLSKKFFVAANTLESSDEINDAIAVLLKSLPDSPLKPGDVYY